MRSRLRSYADGLVSATTSSATSIATAALVLRLGLALTFVSSGLDRLARGPDYAAAYFSSFGLAWPEITGPAISWLELVGGIALVLGIVTRPTAALLAADMVVALAVVRIPAAFRAPSLVDVLFGVRQELLVLAAAVSVVILGGGRWSLDAALAGWRRRANVAVPRPVDS
jgi:putative oxidoreductase